MKKIKPGYGYYDVSKYPLGGCFNRAGADGVRIIKVIRSLEGFPFSQRMGCTEEGLTDDGRKVAYAIDHTEEIKED